MATSSIFHNVVIDTDEKAKRLLKAFLRADADYYQREKNGENQRILKWATDEDIKRMLSKKHEY